MDSTDGAWKSAEWIPATGLRLEAERKRRGQGGNNSKREGRERKSRGITKVKVSFAINSERVMEYRPHGR